MAVADHVSLTSAISGTVIAAPTAANIRAYTTQATTQFPCGPQFGGGNQLNAGEQDLEGGDSVAVGAWTAAKNAPYATSQTLCSKY